MLSRRMKFSMRSVLKIRLPPKLFQKLLTDRDQNKDAELVLMEKNIEKEDQCKFKGVEARGQRIQRRNDTSFIIRTSHSHD